MILESDARRRTIDACPNHESEAERNRALQSVRL